jgi:hypothetical protein
MARKRRPVADPFDQMHLGLDLEVTARPRPALARPKAKARPKAPSRPRPVYSSPRLRRSPYVTAPDGTRTSQTSLPMNSVIGQHFATFFFGAEAVASLPRDAKGQPIGCFSATGPLTSWGRRNGVTRCWIGATPRCHVAILGMWRGRLQPLDGARTDLGPEA